MAAHQYRLVTVPLGQAVVGAVGFQLPGGQVVAAGAVHAAAGVGVVFQNRQGVGLGLACHEQTGFFEVVVAAAEVAGAGLQAQVETLDDRLVGDHAAALVEAGGCQFGEDGLVFAEDQLMALGAVLEVIVDAFLFAQALDEMQVGFIILGAIDSLRPLVAQLEAEAVGEDTVPLEHFGDDLRHAAVLEDALVGGVLQVGQAWYQGDAVAGQAFTGFALGDTVDQAVYALVGAGVGKKCRLV